jgi:hypothetical protein
MNEIEILIFNFRNSPKQKFLFAFDRCENVSRQTSQSTGGERNHVAT